MRQQNFLITLFLTTLLFDNVIFGVRDMTKISKKDYPDLAEKVLREVFLWEEVKDRLGEKATTLSQGQQQRLTLARMLAVEPEVLLMDEPTSSLDEEIQSAFLDQLFLQKEKTGSSLLMVSHNPRIAERFDTITELDKISHT